LKKNIFHSLLGFLLILASCSSDKTKKETLLSDPLVSHIDSSVKANDDFFMYANGKWFKQNPIPPSELQNGFSSIIRDTINAQIRSICESSATYTNPEKGSIKQKIGDFFLTGMDSITLNRNGITGLKNNLKMIDDINDVNGIIKASAYIHTISGSPLFSFYIGQDYKISSKNTVFISQGGLSLPDRDFYFDTDTGAVKIRKKFVEHLTNMFKIIGYDETNSTQAADNLIKLETIIAKTSRKNENLRDPLKNYNKISINELNVLTPNIDWNIFTQSISLNNVDTVVIGQPEFLTALNGYLKTFPLTNWKNYLKYQLIHNLAGYMDDKTYLEDFSFYSGTLDGIKEPKPRWKRVVEQTDISMGELIGQVYVNEYLPKGTKEKLTEIGNEIKIVFAERINNLEWMSKATKEKALKKLSSIVMKVGYPDKWKDLIEMEIARISYVQNVMNSFKWDFNYMISKYGKPVDRSEWIISPQTYDASYKFTNNDLIVPGCNIIIPGYEHKLADDAILYSIIGDTFGHEITHGFDDKGSKYDENGNLNNWWAREDSIEFYTKTKMIVKQFNDYIAVDRLHINGELTQGENIADLGGLMIAYEAFKKTSQFKNNEVIAGLNPSQRFFLGYAFGWMKNVRPEAILSQVKSDVHSPAKYRVIGPLTNMPEFYSAFGIKTGDAMWRPDSTRVVIW